jgi:hypothetical protein
MHENRETSDPGGQQYRTSPAGAGSSRTARANGSEESDRSVVPMSQTNKTGPPEAQFGEGRERTTENTLEPDTCATQSESRVSQGLQGVRQAARERNQEEFHRSPTLGRFRHRLQFVWDF